MTNKDIFLRDGVSVEKFVEFLKSKQPNNKFDMTFHDIAWWLEAPAQPTLTEDERVILRNMPQKEWNYIFRDNIGNIQFEHLKANGAPNSIGRADWYNHLFQFIKERRRIRDKGVAKMSGIFNWDYELVGITDDIIELKKHYDNEITIYKNKSQVVFGYDGAYRFKLSFDEIATLNNIVKMTRKKRRKAVEEQRVEELLK